LSGGGRTNQTTSIVIDPLNKRLTARATLLRLSRRPAHRRDRGPLRPPTLRSPVCALRPRWRRARLAGPAQPRPTCQPRPSPPVLNAATPRRRWKPRVSVTRHLRAPELPGWPGAEEDQAAAPPLREACRKPSLRGRWSRCMHLAQHGPWRWPDFSDLPFQLVAASRATPKAHPAVDATLLAYPRESETCSDR